MLMSLQLHLWTILQHTGVQCPITTALQHWSGQNAFLTALCRSAKQADSMLVSLQIDIRVLAPRSGVQ